MAPLATVLLLLVTVLTAAVGAGLAFDGFGAGSDTALAADTATGQTRFSLHVDAATDRVTVVHDGGDPVTPAALTVRIRIDGTPLAHQPPVPYFAATGFAGTPTGPFNSGFEGPWRVGQPATLELAGANPALSPGDRVRVRLRIDGQRLATLTARAR